VITVPRRKVVSGGLWTPANIAPAQWLDAADASTVTLNDSTVSQWQDKSGNGRHASQLTTATQPAYTTNALNGKNVLTSAGSAKSLNLSNRTVSNSTLFMVLNDTRNTSYAVAFVLNGGSGTKVHNLLTHLAGPHKWGSYSNTEVPANSDINNNYAIAVVENNSDDPATPQNEASVVFYKDGTYDGTGSNTGNAFSSSLIFNDQYGSFFSGNIAEIVFFDSILTTDDRQKMEGYLAHKWGLAANLPAGHPYKAAAPTV